MKTKIFDYNKNYHSCQLIAKCCIILIIYNQKTRIIMMSKIVIYLVQAY